MMKTRPIAIAHGTGDIDQLAGHSHPKILKVSFLSHHPRVVASMSPKMSRPKPMAEVSTPSTSTPLSAGLPRVCGTHAAIPASTSSPNGRLTQKIQRHDAYSVKTPPSSGPRAAMPLMTAPQMPKAAARSLPWKSEFTDDRVDGNTSAPPTPWTVREAMREPGPDAVAASRDPPTKRTTPVAKVVRRPIRSPRRPAPSRRAAKMTLYMALTH